MWIPHVILLINSETDSPKSTRGSCDLHLLTKNLSSNQISSRDDKMSAALGCPIILRLFLRPQNFRNVWDTIPTRSWLASLGDTLSWQWLSVQTNRHGKVWLHAGSIRKRRIFPLLEIQYYPHHFRGPRQDPRLAGVRTVPYRTYVPRRYGHWMGQAWWIHSVHGKDIASSLSEYLETSGFKTKRLQIVYVHVQ